MEYYFKGSSKPKKNRRQFNRRKSSSVTLSVKGRAGLSSIIGSGALRRISLGVVIAVVVIVSSSVVIREAYSYISASSGSFLSSSLGSNEAELKYVPTLLTTEFTIEKNDSLYNILSGIGLNHTKIIEITDKAKPFYNLKRVKEGDVVRVATIDGRFERLEYLYGKLSGIYVEESVLSGIDDNDFANIEDRYSAGKFERPHTVKKVYASASINNSLYGAGVAAGIDPNVVMGLTDIFAWDVDFSTDIRKGDKFGVLYESIEVDGGYGKAMAGRVLGAAIENGGKSYSAIYYKPQDGRGGYYDAEGKSLERALLKSPLRYSRISSYFSKKRYHPILKKYRAHHGIDYAAPTGTPVESSGDGKVVFAGWKSGYGKYIVIRHNSKYTTAYGHLSRISRGIKKGARVAQGQVIGKVGSTGISTGPHLHYEVKVRGKLVNPLRLKSEPRRSISREDMPAFMALNEEIGDQLLEGMVVSGSVVAKKD